jgi:hypothetical protein
MEVAQKLLYFLLLVMGSQGKRHVKIPPGPISVFIDPCCTKEGLFFSPMIFDIILF